MQNLHPIFQRTHNAGRLSHYKIFMFARLTFSAALSAQTLINKWPLAVGTIYLREFPPGNICTLIVISVKFGQ